MTDDKKSYEKDQLSKINEEKIIEDIEIMKLQNLSSKKKYIYILRKNLKKKSFKGYERQYGLWRKRTDK